MTGSSVMEVRKVASWTFMEGILLEVRTEVWNCVK